MSQEPTQALLPGRRAMLVRLTCEEGRRPAMLDMLNTYLDGLAEEPGTEMLVMSVDPDDDTIVWLYEMFKDDDAENAHRSSSGFATMMQQMPDLLGAPPAILRMEPIRLTMQEAVLVEDWSL
jgi:quinol monooxygenase YgiN